jgi:hypothetical protein
MSSPQVQAGTPHDEKYFADMLSKIRSDLVPKIPSIDPESKKLVQSSCVSVVAAQKSRDAAKNAQDKASTPQEQEATNDALKAAEEALTQAMQVAIQASAPVIADLEEKILLHNDTHTLDSLLCPCSVLVNATPKGLATFCSQGETQEKLADELLSNVNVMRDMLQAGGAKSGRYGEAMQIYTSLDTNANDGILDRLALGTSLELAMPMNEFDTKIPVDPIERYHHYKQAHLQGDQLDPSFQDRSTWECRFITNSDAPNEQLQWGRDMIKNYRPDHTELDYHWRYAYIVRTDVSYCKPTWTMSPHTYPQIISGGGECGPRAWFGRFALRAFGIPTWGVRQPGHAALGHWTPNGWVICLGAAWKYSFWEDREGLDFVLEAQAREQTTEWAGVCRLEWVADALGEEASMIGGKLNPDSFWRSLALLQKHRLANAKVSHNSSQSTCSSSSSVLDKMNGLSCDDGPGQMECATTTTVMKLDGRKIVIPAVACTTPTKSSKNAIFQKSFLGGMQLHIRQDQTVEYKLSQEVSGRFQLVIRLVTVHLKTQPLLLTVVTSNTSDGDGSSNNNNSNDDDDNLVTVASIVIPYTVGMWGLTDPVEIELGCGTNILTFTRETPNFGLTMKELILTLCKE